MVTYFPTKLNAHSYVHSSLPFLVSSCNSYTRQVNFQLAAVHWQISEVKCKYSVVYAVLECSVLYAMLIVIGASLSGPHCYVANRDEAQCIMVRTYTELFYSDENPIGMPPELLPDCCFLANCISKFTTFASICMASQFARCFIFCKT